MYPHTPTGKVLGCIVMLAGLLLLALPVTVMTIVLDDRMHAERACLPASGHQRQLCNGVCLGRVDPAGEGGEEAETAGGDSKVGARVRPFSEPGAGIVRSVLSPPPLSSCHCCFSQ